MTKLRKSQLHEITNIFLLANTPKSLSRALLKSTVVDSLRRNCSQEELYAYYNQITVMADRSPFIVALAYSTLIALLVESPPSSLYPDATYLEWGPAIESNLKQFCNTSRIVFSGNVPRPTVRLVSTMGAPLSNLTFTINKPTSQLIT